MNTLKGGNLSNKAGYSIGIRFEGVVQIGLEKKKNPHAIAYIEYLFNQGDINVFLITLGDERKAMSFCYKWGIPYTRIIKADSYLEIPDICLAHNLITYYDIDTNILEQVGNRGKLRTKAEKWISPEDSLQSL